MDTKWFKERLELVGAKQKDIAFAIDRDRTIVSKTITGEKPMRLEFVAGFAQVLRVTRREIGDRAGLDLTGLEIAESQFEHTQMTPLVAWVSAGDLVAATDAAGVNAIGEPVPVDWPHNKLIALKVCGDSINRKAPDGSTIIVDLTQKDPVDGKIFVLRWGGETTVKRYRADPPRLEAYSYQDGYGDLDLVKDGMEIVGRVVRVIIEA